jgi:hypothetical protein
MSDRPTRPSRTEVALIVALVIVTAAQIAGTVWLMAQTLG